jgi:peptide/nickel transport system permease protein
MGLGSYIIRRLLLLIPTLLGVTLLLFAVTQMIDPAIRAMLYVQSDKQLNKLDEVIVKYGLNDPFYIQYFRWLNEVLHGNLGYSKTGKGTVLECILTRLPTTIEITLYSSPVIILVGIYLGVQSAVHKDKLIDELTRALSIIGWSLPSFWLGIMLLSFSFAATSSIGLAGGLFPPGRLDLSTQSIVNSASFVKYTGLVTIDGLLNGNVWVTLDGLRHLVLPVLTLTVIQIALIVRVMRSSMLEALGKGYIISARAKGLTKKTVINKHARRNALIPVVTLSGLLVAGMMTGVIITESVFAFPGIGRFAADAALQLDLPAVLGFALLTGIVFVVANLIVDVLYAYIDPRIRLG